MEIEERTEIEALRKKVVQLEGELAQYKAIDSHLKKTESFYRILFEEAPLGYQSLDQAGCFLEINSAWTELLGYSREEILGEWFGDFLHPEDVPKFHAGFPRFKAKGEVHDIRFRLRAKDGGYVFVSFDGRIEHSEQGAFRRTHCVLQDISQREKVEQQFKKYHDILEKITSRTPIFLFVINVHTRRFSYMNRMMLNFAGTELEEINRNFSRFRGRLFHADDAQEIDIAFDVWKKMKENDIRERMIRMNDKEGNERWFSTKEVVFSQDDKNNAEEVLMVLVDTTETVETKRMLARSEEKFKTIFNLVPASIIITRAEDGDIVDVNNQLLFEYGKSKGEIIGKTTTELKLWPEGERERMMRELTDKGRVRNLEVEIDAGLPAPTHRSVSVEPVDVEDTRYYIGVAVDITAIKEAQKEVERSREELRIANAEKDKLFNLIAHDLINPIHVLIGFTDTLEKKYDELSDADARRYLQMINRTTKTTYDMLENLLHWSRTLTGRIQAAKKPLNLAGVFEEMSWQLTPLAEAKGITLSAEMKKDCFVLADRQMTGVLLRNLVTNAVKFTPEGGKVDIYCRVLEEMVEVNIKDTGVGMTDEQMKNLFLLTGDSSTNGTNSEKGTGIGLIICQEFVKLMGGEIRVQSAPEQGSTFTFTLPKAE